jgi:hypothetical protein
MDDYIPTIEAAKIAKMNQDYIRLLCRTGKVESRKFGHVTMVSCPSLLAYLKTDRSPGVKRKVIAAKA